MPIFGNAGLSRRQSDAEGLQEAALQYVEERWRMRRNAFLVYHNNIWRSRIYYAGEFWFSFDEATKSFKKITPEDDWVPTPEINRFSPAVDAVVSNFATIPEVEASPKPDNSETAITVAQICNDLAGYCIKDNALRSDYKSEEDKAGIAAQEFVLSGCIFTNVYPRDEQIGERPRMRMETAYNFRCPQCDIFQDGLDAPMESCPQCGGAVEAGQSEMAAPVTDDEGNVATEPIMRKKIVVETADAGCMFPRPSSRSMADTPDIFYADRMALDTIYHRWGFEGDPDSEYPDSYNIMLEHALNYYFMGFSTSANDVKDGALVIQAYVPKGKVREFPEGFYLVMVNHKVAYFKPWDEEFCEHPLTKGDFYPIPRLFFPRSLAFDLAEIQKLLVEYECLFSLHAKSSATEPIIVDENTKVSEITGRADKIIYWRSFGTGAREPHRMKHGSLDEGVYAQREQLKSELENISHAVSVFKGQQPGSVTAASAISQLRGQAELMFSKPVGNWVNLWKETIRKVIKNYQKYFSVQQLAEILGEDKLSEIELFKQADLDKCIEFIATVTGLPKTRDEKRQEMMVLFDKGALDINDPNVRQKVFELFGETGMFETFNLDARRARINIRMIKEGGQALFRPGIDDPQVHLGIALEAAKGLDFEKWHPEAQQRLIGYIQGIQSLMAPIGETPTESGPPGRSSPGSPSQGAQPGGTA